MIGNFSAMQCTVFLLWGTFSSCGAFAETKCASPKTTLEINECAADDLKNIDSKLNEAYNRFLKDLGKR